MCSCGPNSFCWTSSNHELQRSVPFPPFLFPSLLTSCGSRICTAVYCSLVGFFFSPHPHFFLHLCRSSCCDDCCGRCGDASRECSGSTHERGRREREHECGSGGEQYGQVFGERYESRSGVGRGGGGCYWVDDVESLVMDIVVDESIKEKGEKGREVSCAVMWRTRGRNSKGPVRPVLG